MKPIILALAALALTACQSGSMSNMSQEDKALAVMLFAKPSYTPYQPVPFYPMQIPASSSFSCSGASGIVSCY
jgi:hypothetical protein